MSIDGQGHNENSLNNAGQMTKTAAMPIYDKILEKFSLQEPLG